VLIDAIGDGEDKCIVPPRGNEKDKASAPEGGRQKNKTPPKRQERFDEVGIQRKNS